MQKIESQATDEPASLPSKQPRNQATRQIGTCRQPGQQPTSERQETSKQCIHTHSEPASMAAKQPGHQPARQPPKQPASQTEAKTNKTERQRGTQRQQYTQPSRGSGELIASW